MLIADTGVKWGQCRIKRIRLSSDSRQCDSEQPITVGIMLAVLRLEHSAEGEMFGRQELYR